MSGAAPPRRIRRARRLAATIRQLDHASHPATEARIVALAGELGLPSPEGADPAEQLARIAGAGARLPPEIPVLLAALLRPLLLPGGPAAPARDTVPRTADR
ncbi:hypothetical protein [Paracraurococcus lichenis]|uniref:Uncharacterized protein n=1 Tax=Paracraurococcus lichenis TaxID=3064888 RepID=A0ABT9EB51_9PROT|nr:hypothetical protein [Paracraurococcus sp. LOR1-02]MDO9713401.1 hypothetical protein [Paracraurococcus sp. LOR1-02]